VELRGAQERRMRSVRLSVLLVLVTVVVAAACGGDGVSGPMLIDGSRAAAVPRRLRHLGGRLVLTKALVVPAHEVASQLRACDPAIHLRREQEVVRRIGLETETLTFQTRSLDVRGCDSARRAAVESNGRWCGTSAGLWPHGRLRDPRLELCHDSNGRAVAAFAWIDPRSSAEWIVVDQGGRRDVYEPAGGLPIRIATSTGIDVASSSAVFDYAEYDYRGRLLERSTIHPFVAG
jgi:hypothetical protein